MIITVDDLFGSDALCPICRSNPIDPLWSGRDQHRVRRYGQRVWLLLSPQHHLRILAHEGEQR